VVGSFYLLSNSFDKQHNTPPGSKDLFRGFVIRAWIESIAWYWQWESFYVPTGGLPVDAEP
jgi:hypothetical protein